MPFYSILTIKNILFWKSKNRSRYSISQSKFWGDVKKEIADADFFHTIAQYAFLFYFNYQKYSSQSKFWGDVKKETADADFFIQ